MAKHAPSMFADGNSYTNVYFLKIDASGHSNIVVTNTHDRVNKLFDLLEDTVQNEVEKSRRLNTCRYAEFWGWQGDGGLCVIHDELESTALRTALDSAFGILDNQLATLQRSLRKLRMKGSLHIRVAIHKGSYTYKGDSKRGSIHSKDLNFVCHLETRTPRDSVTISEDVYACCDQEQMSEFEPLDFGFEGKSVYIHSLNPSQDVHYQWLERIEFHDSFKANVFPERLSEEEKAAFIGHAQKEVVDVGTASKTCSYYLRSGQRPAYYRDTALSLIERGVNYTCLLLNPDSEMMDTYSTLRNEDLKKKTLESLERFRTFAESVSGMRGEFKVLLYSLLPYFACIGVDRKASGALILSPYMPNNQNLKIDRADTMHLLFSQAQNAKVCQQINDSIDNLIEDERTVEYDFSA